jgi:HlyD family secretion protein
MEKKAKKKAGKKWIWMLGIAVVVVGAAVVFVLPRLQTSSSATTTYKTQAVAKGSLTATVGANGNVYPKQAISLAWQTSGIVSKVDVTKGQKVQKGDVLAELDSTSLPESVLSAANDLNSAQKALDDLLNSNSTRAAAQLALLNAEQTLVDAQKTAQSKLYQRASQSQIDAAKASLIQAQNALDQASASYNNAKNSADEMMYASALSRFAAAQSTFDSAQLSYQYVQSLPDTLSVQIVNADVDVAQAAYDDAKRAWERVKDGPDATDVAAAQAKVDIAQATLDEAKITAPIGGTITAIDATSGDLVSASTAAFELDDMDHLYVDISVSEVDISAIQVGQPAEITFDAIVDKTYTAKVIDIANTGSSSSGSVNFNVTLEITNADTAIKPGMTATATITTKNKTGILLVPSSAIRTLNSQSIVYIQMTDGNLRPAMITTGDTDSTNTEVTGGNLQEGDLLVTNPPSSTTALTSQRQGGLLGGLFGGIFGGGGGGGMPGGGGGPGGDFGGPPSGGGIPGGGQSGGRSGSSGGSSSGGGNSQSR